MKVSLCPCTMRINRPRYYAPQSGEMADHPQYEPFSAFLILLNPEILLVFIFSSVVYLEFYSVL